MPSTNENKKELDQYCDYNCNCNCKSNFISEYPLLTTLITSGTILSTTALLSQKGRKILIPTFKYIGKQQLKLFAGIGILSIANYITKENFLSKDILEKNNLQDINPDDDNEIILNSVIKF
ncbi:hypothetical protein HF520_08520 [Romboutsia sp. CE17]|uniref:hypothetical protein n=1 Tax=Romboutsia sp. CE17 TaxID=2724150 RepID=UPI001442CD1F|nr:hypothetical protein [Romboutsia sp. CE17]QJA08988.1 hypothetical protein HF520_08520 [Romboutsia sp. CE17]